MLRRRATRPRRRVSRLLALAVALVVGPAAAVVADRVPDSARAAVWHHLDPALPGIVEAGDGTTARVLAAGPDEARIVLHAGTGRTSLRLARAPGEHWFGAGERCGSFDLTGRRMLNRTGDGMGGRGAETSYSPTPFLLSSRGYAVALDTTAQAVLDLTDPSAVELAVDAPDLTVRVFTGPDPAAVLTARARWSGFPPVPPAWGLGVWTSRIGGSARVESDLAALRAAGVPLDAVWVYDLVDPASGIGWPWHIHGPIPPGPYPDPAAFVAGLHRRGLAVLGYLTPFVLTGTPGFAEARDAGYLVGTATGAVLIEPWMTTARAWVDFTNPDATRWWQGRVRHALTVVGLDGAMQDYGEEVPPGARFADGRDGVALRNAYTVLYSRAAREIAQQVRPDGTVLFARSGYTGTQPLATGRFTGDQTRDWSPATGLPSVLAGMLAGSVSGWPLWGPDIGGFLDGAGARDRELWSRWVQLGAVSPVMRDMLGQMRDPVGALTDPSTTALFARYARLHEALRPTLLAAAERAHRTGEPIMRPLWLDEPGDPDAWTAPDEYRLGPDLVVAPVLHPGVRHRPAHVPPGRWRDPWTGTVHSGPATVDLPAPVETVPLLVRENAGPPGPRGPVVAEADGRTFLPGFG